MNTVKQSWMQKGYADEPLPEGIDLKAEIRRLCREKNAIILAHYYTEGEIQDLADYVGDSLGLARQAARTDADIIVMCGVHFMGETNAILCPDKKVLVPDLNATCSLAESCPAEAFKAFVESHPDHQVISYVNTSAAVKALTDVVVTSGNARKIVDTFPPDAKLIFGPDRNLGNYINSVTGRNMLLWDGACHVHERFSVEKLLQMKREHPEAKVPVQPKSDRPVYCSARRQHLRLQRVQLHAPLHPPQGLQRPALRVAHRRGARRGGTQGRQAHRAHARTQQVTFKPKRHDCQPTRRSTAQLDARPRGRCLPGAYLRPAQR